MKINPKFEKVSRQKQSNTCIVGKKAIFCRQMRGREEREGLLLQTTIKRALNLKGMQDNLEGGIEKEGEGP